MLMHRFLLLLVSVQSLVLHHVHNTSSNSTQVTTSNTTSGLLNTPKTLLRYYYSHAFGRGIWKWNNALVAYQHLFDSFVGKPVKLAEVGVQSGGSLDMWRAVLGRSCYVYGIDINPATKQFADSSASITIGDQADLRFWVNFWKQATSTLDILIHDGGHEPHQMSMTLQQAFPHLNPGGFVAIEDIHGRQYTPSFYLSAANSIHKWHWQGLVKSVSMLPFLLIVKKTGRKGVMPTADVTVDTFPALWAALAPNAGKTIAVRNPAAGSFLAMPTLYTIFEQLAPLNDYQMIDVPLGCHSTSASDCTVSIANSQQQAQITAVDIYPTALYVSVPATPPVIKAVRRGTVWLPYG